MSAARLAQPAYLKPHLSGAILSKNEILLRPACFRLIFSRTLAPDRDTQ